MAFGSPDRSRAFFVLYDDRITNPGELDDHFVQEFESASETAGLGKRISGRFVLVQGVKSYERTGAPLVRGKIFSMISRTVPTRGRFFGLQGFRFTGGNADEDAEIRQCLESFRFLTPPPSMVTPDPVVAKREAEVKETFQRGQAVGRMMSYLFVPAIIIGAIVGIIWLVTRRGKSRPPRVPASSSPPPPPPPPAPLATVRTAAPPPLPAEPPPPTLLAPAPVPSAKAPGPPAPAQKPALPAIAKEPVPPVPAKESAPPVADPPPPPAAPVVPPKVNPPLSSVIRPRQRHMRQ